jgi:hypothetical protein
MYRICGIVFAESSSLHWGTYLPEVSASLPPNAGALKCSGETHTLLHSSVVDSIDTPRAIGGSSASGLAASQSLVSRWRGMIERWHIGESTEARWLMYLKTFPGESG